MIAMHCARPLVVLAFISSVFGWSARGQSHFQDCRERTGSTATLLIPTNASFMLNGSPLSPGDEIAVFTPDGICTGTTTWTGKNGAMAVWGDDPMTAEVDGHRQGEAMVFRVWDRSSSNELPTTSGQIDVTFRSDADYYRTDDTYQANGIYVISALIVHDETLRLDGSGTPSSIDQTKAPTSVQIHPNYPNPFNATTTFTFDIVRTSYVSLTVHDSIGRQVASLITSAVGPGRHAVKWDADDLPSGRYLYRFQADGTAESGVLTLLK